MMSIKTPLPATEAFLKTAKLALEEIDGRLAEIDGLISERKNLQAKRKLFRALLGEEPEPAGPGENKRVFMTTEADAILTETPNLTVEELYQRMIERGNVEPKTPKHIYMSLQSSRKFKDDGGRWRLAGSPPPPVKTDPGNKDLSILDWLALILTDIPEGLNPGDLLFRLRERSGMAWKHLNPKAIEATLKRHHDHFREAGDRSGEWVFRKATP